MTSSGALARSQPVRTRTTWLRRGVPHRVAPAPLAGRGHGLRARGPDLRPAPQTEPPRRMRRQWQIAWQTPSPSNGMRFNRRTPSRARRLERQNRFRRRIWEVVATGRREDWGAERRRCGRAMSCAATASKPAGTSGQSRGIRCRDRWSNSRGRRSPHRRMAPTATPQPRSPRAARPPWMMVRWSHARQARPAARGRGRHAPRHSTARAKAQPAWLPLPKSARIAASWPLLLITWSAELRQMYCRFG